MAEGRENEDHENPWHVVIDIFRRKNMHVANM